MSESRFNAIGRKGQFAFSNGQYVTGVVERVPSGTGDTWQVRNDDGSITLIQQFDRVLFAQEPPQ